MMKITLELDPWTAHRLTWLCLMSKNLTTPEDIIAPLIQEQYELIKSYTPISSELKETTKATDN